MYFILIHQKVLIYFFNKFDYLLGSMNLHSQQNVFISRKLYGCVFLYCRTHQNLLDIFVINFLIWNQRNHCLLFFLEFLNLIDESFSIIFSFTCSSILIYILLSFLKFFKAGFYNKVSFIKRQ